MFVLGQIIAKSLVLVDYVLEGFAWANQATISFDPNSATCGIAASYTAGLTDCGATLVNQLQTLTVAGVGLLATLLPALNVHTV
jgi:hypothetical protein